MLSNAQLSKRKKKVERGEGERNDFYYDMKMHLVLIVGKRNGTREKIGQKLS